MGMFAGESANHLQSDLEPSSRLPCSKINVFLLQKAKQLSQRWLLFPKFVLVEYNTWLFQLSDIMAFLQTNPETFPPSNIWIEIYKYIAGK